MSRTVRGRGVTVELSRGSLTVSWPRSGVRAGPLTAEAHLAGEIVRSDQQAGSWRVETGDAYDRPGAWARWTSRDRRLRIAAHVPTDDDIVVVHCAYEASREGTLERLVPVAGPLEWSASPPARSRLVEGYDSWAYAGVRSAGEPGTSWWGTVVAGGDAAVGVQALDAHRFATAVTSRPGREQLLVAVTCGATPPEAIVAGTWGYETLAPPGLGLPLEAGTTERTPPIALTAARDPLAVAGELAALAGKASGARRWTGAPIVGWESWYHYGLVVEPEHVLENARVLLERYGTRPGFDVIQLDDGWQTTYGAWWPNDRFPADLRELTDAVRALGGRPGLWLAPFMVQPGAPGLGTEQPGWMVRGDDGAPLLDRYGRLGLDASNPAVVDWLRDLGRQVRAWGFEMVKLDFLYLGAVEGGRHDARSTGTAALRRGLGAMAEALGDDVYVLGCGMPLLPAVGVCHGNRVGHDLAVPVLLREFGQPLQDGWTGFHGIRPQARNVAARFALHRRWFEADPDVVMAWDGETDGYSVEEARTLATVAALCGGPFLLADELAALPQPARAVLEQPGLLDLVGGDGFRPVDLFARVDRPETEHFFTQGEPPSVWRAERGGRPVAALFNWADAPSSRPVPDGFAGSSELWTGDDVEGPTIEIPAHAVRVLRA